MKNQVLLFLLAISFQVAAQQNTVTGVVTDSDNAPLPGVNVMVKETTKGTQTDFDGQYSVVAYQGQTLVFSYIGFKTKEVKIGVNKTINVQLEESSEALSEIVVTGYSIQEDRSMVPTAAQIKRRKQKAYHQSISQALQGNAAGVQVAEEVSFMKIRGKTSIKAGNEPLYIVDGTPIRKQNNTVIAQLDPSKIDKINIYKGAKARSLFGSSAKNGCIVITTKQGNYQIQNDEKYAEITENQFEHVSLSPLSTFSIDVDKASYSNIRRMINNGQQIPVDAVKVEEMINYFNYSYPQPKEHPFSINTEVVQTPWNKDTQLVRIGLQGKTYQNEELPASNLTFLIDVSGSMGSANKLPLLKSAFKLLVNQLREKDKVSIVVYAGAAGVVLEPTRGDKKMEITKALENLHSGGSTAGGAGIELAYKLASKISLKMGTTG